MSIEIKQLDWKENKIGGYVADSLIGTYIIDFIINEYVISLRQFKEGKLYEMRLNGGYYDSGEAKWNAQCHFEYQIKEWILF